MAIGGEDRQQLHGVLALAWLAERGAHDLFGLGEVETAHLDVAEQPVERVHVFGGVIGLRMPVHETAAGVDLIERPPQCQQPIRQLLLGYTDANTMWCRLPRRLDFQFANGLNETVDLRSHRCLQHRRMFPILS